MTIHYGNLIVDGILGTGNEASGGYIFPTTVGISGQSFIVTPDGTVEFGDFKLAYESQAPATSGALGLPGQMEWDSNYLYICVSENYWKRAQLSDW